MIASVMFIGARDIIAGVATGWRVRRKREEIDDGRLLDGMNHDIFAYAPFFRAIVHIECSC